MTLERTRVSDLVCRSARAWPDRMALQDLSGSRQVTYGELWSSVERSAAVLRARGLHPGDRVLLAAEAGPDWMTGFLAIAHAGLVSVPIPAATPAALARLVVMFAGVRAWIDDQADGELSAALADLPRLTPADLADSTALPLPPSSSDPKATAVLVFTSGSTTRPRAVAHSHAALRANLRSLLAARQADSDEALLSTLPPSHAYELVAGSRRSPPARASSMPACRCPTGSWKASGRRPSRGW